MIVHIVKFTLAILGLLTLRSWFGEAGEFIAGCILLGLIWMATGD